MVDRPPRDTGESDSSPLPTSQGNRQPEIWINIGADGTVTHGVGVPEWWTSGPQSC